MRSQVLSCLALYHHRPTGPVRGPTPKIIRLLLGLGGRKRVR